jgi:hypothetical protein
LNSLVGNVAVLSVEGKMEPPEQIQHPIHAAEANHDHGRGSWLGV